jgi:tripartite-type tricarboxylate transporter receptor subunit TctC
MALRTLLASLLAGLASAAAPAQSIDYPSRAVRIIVPLAAGGNVDIVARTVAEQLGKTLGQPVLVENRPGASSLVGTQFVAKAASDGYTLLAIANTFATVPLIVPNPGYDPLRDFAGVTLTCLVPQVLVVNPALSAHSVRELIALAKSEPGKISYASSGNGSTGHMAAELFNRQAGVRMLHVPYKGNSQALIDVIGGQVAMMFDQVSTSGGLVKAGKVRALGVTTLERSPLFPELPTLDEQGLKGYEDVTWNGIVAPAATPKDILSRLNSEIRRIAANAQFRERYAERGIEVVASPTPEAFTAYIKSEADGFVKLVRESGMRAE